MGLIALLPSLYFELLILTSSYPRAKQGPSLKPRNDRVQLSISHLVRFSATQGATDELLPSTCQLTISGFSQQLLFPIVASKYPY